MENKCISALEYIRTNRKTSLDEVNNLFGADGSFAFHTFQARYSMLRKQKDGRSLDDKREEAINGMIEDFKSKKLKNPVQAARRKELITNILIVVGSLIGAALLFIFGWAVILLVPPIWLVVIIIVWIIKKT